MISENNLQEFTVQNYKIGKDEINLSLKYITLGKLNKNKDNLIIFPPVLRERIKTKNI
jgi:hypothetical protein